MVNRMKKTLALSLGLILMLLTITACESDVSGPRFSDETYSLTGLLIAGSSIDLENPVYVTKSSTIDEFDFLKIFVFDAIVTVYEISGSDTTAILNLSPALDLGSGEPGDIPKIKYIDPSGHIIQSELLYRIEALIPGYEPLIWAETTVPKTAIPEPDWMNQNVPGEGFSFNSATMDSIVFGDVGTRYPLALNTLDYTGNVNLFVEIFCMEPFSTDLEWTIPIFGITNADSSIAWIYNSSGDSMRRISIFASYISRNYPQAGGNFALLRDFSQAIAFYGRYRFSIYSVDDNYFRYRYMAEGYLNGGVHNALGYFGSASGGKIYARIVKAPPA